MNNTKICCNCKFFKNSTHYCRCLEKETLCKDTCGSFEFLKPTDWEQRRYEIAKQMMLFCAPKWFHNINQMKEDKCAQAAVKYADALIKELKKTSK